MNAKYYKNKENIRKRKKRNKIKGFIKKKFYKLDMLIMIYCERGRRSRSGMIQKIFLARTSSKRPHKKMKTSP